MMARAREIGRNAGLRARAVRQGPAYRAVGFNPDALWVARQLLSARLAEYDRSVGVPSVRSAADDVWVRGQIAKRDAHVRRLAEGAGIDPDLAVEAARTIGLGAAFAGHFRV
jgi:hypothetical protein